MLPSPARPEAPARRVVCLLESALSTLYMLGADGALVGVPADATRGEAGRRYAALDPRLARGELATPGNWDFVSIERVLALRPDLVVLWAAQREAIDALERHGLRVHGVDVRSFADVHREVIELGRRTGREARARELVTWAQCQTAAMRAAAAPGPAPRAYFMWPQSPLDTAGRASAAHELLELAGAVNVCSAATEHVVVRIEDVLGWRPELIVMWPSALSPAALGELPGWRAVPAVRQGRVHVLPSPFWCDLWTLKYIYAAKVVAAWCRPDPMRPAPEATELRPIMVFLYGPRAEAWFR
ncbi:MAG: ABC transporter substrate-binding protein [Kiritimatiellae bacterium]|nr:ABC transporter substrate-binding protein [Kiritimatiellia bacterium]